MSKKANQDIKQLRAIGHKLKPVVTVAGNGLSEGVAAELDRALTDHELIKVKLAVGSREARVEMAAQISAQFGAEVVQSVGNILLLLRRSPSPDPRLSNLIKIKPV
ncbi:MAG: YhbY family RNA-binding protein [Halioglobus sp.]|nr:YhbY family RNA-binding protein [Halioglobus sp.]